MILRCLVRLGWALLDAAWCLVVWLALVLCGWCGMCSGVLLCCLICWYSGLLFAFGEL